MKSGTAIVLTDGLLAEPPAKTAHGLIRGSDRFTILGVIDKAHNGKDAGEVLDNRNRNIPVWASVEEALQKAGSKIEYCIVGIAPKGGKIPQTLKSEIIECIKNQISIVSGLHDFISEIDEISTLASIHGASIIDVRKPKPASELHFWTGEIYQVTCPIVAVLGLETNLGKRTTSRMLKHACIEEGMKAEMIYTGQTGWMQDGKYGFIFDSTINDFVSGELEHEIVRCFKEQNPDIIFLEGQSGLRHPSGPCGAEYLVSANAKKTVLVFAPGRKYYSGKKEWGPLPSVESEIELIKMYGSEVIALVLNTSECTDEQAYVFQKEYQKRFNLPVLLPIQEGVHALVPFLKKS